MIQWAAVNTFNSTSSVTISRSSRVLWNTETLCSISAETAFICCDVRQWLFLAKSLTGLLVKNFQLVLSIRHVMSFAQQAEQTLVFNINRPPHLSFNTKWHWSLFSQLYWDLSLLGVNKRQAHAQVGLLNRFNSKFPTSIPDPFIWKSPRFKNIHIAWQRDTSQKIAKTLSGEAALVAIFPV